MEVSRTRHGNCDVEARLRRMNLDEIQRIIKRHEDNKQLKDDLKSLFATGEEIKSGVINLKEENDTLKRRSKETQFQKNEHDLYLMR
jgi:translation initiation factor 1 (eIF-1/SUI1)